MKSNILFLLFIIFSLYSCTNQEYIYIKSDSGFTSKFRRADYTRIYNYNSNLSELLDSLKIKASSLHIVVDKSDYILSVLYDTVIIKQYPVVLGEDPINDKLQQGDNCTPEGTFNIRDKYAHKKWSKFIWLNYPTSESLLKIAKAKREGIVPQESSPGGAIGIHGVEDGFDYAIDYGINWTAGCISLKNKDINELYPIINKETRIIILK